MICPNCLSQMNKIDATNRLRESFFCSRCNRVYEGVVIPTVTVAEDGFTTYYTDGIKKEVRTKAKNTTDAVEILKRNLDMTLEKVITAKLNEVIEQQNKIIDYMNEQAMK